MDLAHGAAQLDAAGGADLRPLVVGEVGRQGADGGDGLVVVEAAAPGVETKFLDAAQLLGSAQLEFVVWC